MYCVKTEYVTAYTMKKNFVGTLTWTQEKIVLYVDKMYVAHRMCENVCIEHVVYRTAPGRAAKL
jgi:thymidine kinase